MEVGHLRGVGDDGIDHDHRPERIFGDLVEHHASSREALRHPWILPDEDGYFGVLELAPRVAAVQVRIDPRFARLLLRQCTRPILRAQRFQECAAVGPAEMIALSAAAVVEDLVSAVGFADALEALGDLDNRGVPVDFLICSVGASAQRGGQATAAVLVMVQPQRLVAGVALRRRMRLVAADAGQLAILDLYDDAAIAFAQDARRGLPIGSGHRGAYLPGRSSASSRSRSWR